MYEWNKGQRRGERKKEEERSKEKKESDAVASFVLITQKNNILFYSVQYN